MRSGKMHGFTLIEIMIVVVIVGILAGIAIPSYQTYIENTRRTIVQGDLVELAQFMERYYSENFQYVDGSGNLPNLPFDASPRGADPNDRFYEISVSSNDKNSFTLTASPDNAQANDRCGDLTYNEEGTRGASGDDVDSCW